MKAQIHSPFGECPRCDVNWEVVTCTIYPNGEPQTIVRKDLLVCPVCEDLKKVN